MSDDSMLELFRQEAETQIAILTQELLILEPTFRRSLNRIDGYKIEKFKPEVITQ